MLFQKLLSFSALACLAAAVPLQHQHQLKHHQKREVVWTTQIVQEFVTVVVATTTVHLQPGQMPPTGAPAASPPTGAPAGPPPADPTQAEHHTRPRITSHIKSTVTVHRAPTPSSPSAVNSSPAAASPPAEPTTAQTTAAASPAPTSTASPSSGGGGGSSPNSGSKYSGDITYYTPGLGSCGITNSASDMIVALAEDMMLPEDGANPNDNPLCGKSITISYGGKTAVATIEDTCPGCAGASLDLTPSLFEIFAPLATGRVSGVEWWFN